MPTPEESKAAGYFDIAEWGEKDVKGAYDKGSAWELPDGTKIDPSTIPDAIGGEGRAVPERKGAPPERPKPESPKVAPLK